MMDEGDRERARQRALELVVSNAVSLYVVEDPKRIVDTAAILAAFLIGETK